MKWRIRGILLACFIAGILVMTGSGASITEISPDLVSLGIGTAVRMDDNVFPEAADTQRWNETRGDPELIPPGHDVREPAEQGAPSLGTVTVTGNFLYDTTVTDGTLDDFRYGETGSWPLQWAFVEITNARTDAVLGSTFTDWDGRFSVSIANPYPDSIGFITYAYTRYDHGTGPYELRVVSEGESLSGRSDVWSMGTTVGQIPSTSTTYNIGGWGPVSDSAVLHAFWLHQDLVRALDFMPLALGSSTIRWYPTQEPLDKAHYHQGGQIHIGGDQYRSADTTVHELGHNYMYNVRGSWTSDCPDGVTMNQISGSRCGYTDGWAFFYPLAVNGNPLYQYAGGGYVNFETPTWGIPYYWDTGDQVAGRVAGALYDMYDLDHDGYEHQFYSFYSIDQAMRTNPGWTLSAYWGQWLAKGYPADAKYALYQNTIDYNFNIPPPSLRISSPNGGETWVMGSSHSIIWFQEGLYGKQVDIALHKRVPTFQPPPDDYRYVFIRDIGKGVSASSYSYPWIIPEGLPEGGYKVRISSTEDTSVEDYSDAVFTLRAPVDTTPPAPVTGLRNTTCSASSLNWTWTDPVDPDFSKVKVYVNGAFKNDVARGIRYYLATGLFPDTSYTIGTCTVDTAGNTNPTWVNHTARTAKDPFSRGKGIFRPAAWNNWILDASMNGVTDATNHFGQAGDIPLIGDFNSAGSPDRAVFRNGDWMVDLAMDGSINTRDHYGKAGDIPLAGDLNDAGLPDRAVFRKGEWIIDYNMDGSINVRDHFGQAGDIPLIGDFNNDGTPDRAVFRGSIWNNWIIDYHMDGSVNLRNHYGQAGDIPIVGDFNNDGLTDRAVFRKGEWIIDYTIDGSINSRQRYGMAGDIPLVWAL